MPLAPAHDCLSLNDLPRAVLHHVFDFLGPRDLCVASAVCQRWRDLNHDAAANQAWQAFYGQKWRPPAPSRLQQVSCWQGLYSCKMQQRWSYGGRASTDLLQGHADAVRCIGLLPACNLIASGSRDRSVKIWDLKAGMMLSSTRSPVGSVRSLALDEDLLVVGGTDPSYQLCTWRPPEVLRLPNDGDHFDMQRPTKLTGHTGPISALALDSMLIYSGSWDYTVRMWRRGSHHMPPQCVSVLNFDDWIWSVCPRGNYLLVAAGGSAMVHDSQTGQCLRSYTDTEGQCGSVRVEGTLDGRLLFATSQSGSLVAYDLRSSSPAPVATLWEQKATVCSLSFEDPWLAAASSDGAITLLDINAALKAKRAGGRQGQGPLAASGARSFTAPGCSPQCVDVAGQWLAAGEQGGLVRTWDFTHADAARERSQRGRQARVTRRQRRAESRATAAAELSGGYPESSGTPPESSFVMHAEPAAQRSREQSLAAARQALLKSLLEAKPESEGEEPAVEGEPEASSAEQHGQQTGAQDEEVESASESETSRRGGAVPADDFAAQDTQQLGPVRRGREGRRQGRRGCGKGAGPHSGPLSGRGHAPASPPPLAVSRSQADPATRVATSMATWRIVRPARLPSSSLGK